MMRPREGMEGEERERVCERDEKRAKALMIESE
jgi:hypothetical protein